APEGASFEYTESYMQQVEETLMQVVDGGEARRVLVRVPAGWGGGGVNTGRALVLLEDWDKRERSAQEIADWVRLQIQDLPGVRVRVSTPAGLGVRGGDRPFRVVLG